MTTKVTKPKPTVSSPAMMVWQLDRLIGQLILVGDHYADPNCPCSYGYDDPKGEYVSERCIPKHLLAIYEYATETAVMAGDANLKAELLAIAEDARRIRDTEKRKLCGQYVDQEDMLEWSRAKRKLLEPYTYDTTCLIPGYEEDKDEPPAPPKHIAPIQVCATGHCQLPPAPAKGLQWPNIYKPLNTSRAEVLRETSFYSETALMLDFLENYALMASDKQRDSTVNRIFSWTKKHVIARVASNYQKALDIAKSVAGSDVIEHYEQLVKPAVNKLINQFNKAESRLDKVVALDRLANIAHEHGKSEKGEIWAPLLFGIYDYNDSSVTFMARTLNRLAGNYPAPSAKQPINVCTQIARAKKIHEDYMHIPEDPVTGDHPWHAHWINVYDQTLDKMQCGVEPPVPPQPFGWVGGKKQLAKTIVALLPPHKTYVEAFCGAAAVFWKKERSAVEVLNDLDKDLIRFYRHIGDIDRCDIKDISRDWDTLRNKQGKQEPCEFLSNVLCSFGDMRRTRTLNKGKEAGGGYHRCYANAPSFHKYLDQYKERLKGVKLHNEDWLSVVRRYDAKDTFFYLDPPYHGTSRDYNHNGTELPRLAEVLPKLKGKWLLSYDDHPDVRKAFRAFHIIGVTSNYTVQSGSNSKKGKQVLIANYPIKKPPAPVPLNICINCS